MKASSLRTLLAVAVAGCFFVLAMGASAHSTSWTANAIGGSGFTPADINSAGTVVGYAGIWPEPQQAIVVRNGVANVLPTPDNVVQADAQAINNAGTIAGNVTFDDYTQQAVTWDSSGHITFLGVLPDGSWSRAHDINDRGQVVGSADPGYQPVVWDKGPGSIKALPTPPDLPAYYIASAEAINNSGRIVGSVANYAILWKNASSAPTILPPLVDGTSAVANDINNAGQIVGYSFTTTATGNLAPAAALWQAGTVRDLGVGHRSFANGINDQGTIVGIWQQDIGSEPHAVVIQGSVITPLNPLAGDTASWASAINNEGRVVGYSGWWGSNMQGAMWTQ